MTTERNPESQLQCGQQCIIPSFENGANMKTEKVSRQLTEIKGNSKAKSKGPTGRGINLELQCGRGPALSKTFGH